MDVKNVDIDDLKPYEYNPKTHSKEQIDKIARSIEEFGFLVPILLDDSYNIIAGHGRVLAARVLGVENVPTISVNHLTDAQIRAYRIADNKLTESAWNIELLGREIDLLRDVDFDIDLTGFEDFECNDLFTIASIEEPPTEFPEFGEDMETDNECPKCGYKW